MKKKPVLNRRQLVTACLAFTLFTALTLMLFLHKRDEKHFQRLTKELFLEELAGNTLNMHYTLADPKAFGLKKYHPVLPEKKPGNQEEPVLLLQELDEIKKDRLSAEAADTYELLKKNLSLSVELSSYYYYEEPLSPSGGAQTQLPTLLAEYRFRTKQDVEDYLALLDQTDEYFASLLAFEKEKAKTDLFFSSSALQRVCRQCDTVLTKESLDDNTHFLLTTFSERLSDPDLQKKLSPGEIREYQKENRRLLETVLLPAYQELSRGLGQLEPFCKEENTSGLGSHPGGKDYYPLLLISQTGSYRSIPEIRQMLRDSLTLEYNTLCALLKKYPHCKDLIKEGTYTSLPGCTPGSILGDLRQRTGKDFPALPSGKTGPKVTVKRIAPALEAYTAPAFYLTSPIDDTDNNVIYINYSSNPSDTEIYTTLAHEGFPGHLYQNVYCNRFLKVQGQNPLRTLFWYGGYQEGWALYTEFIAYDYLSTYFAEQGKEKESICIQIEKHNRKMQLCLYSLLDILIHYEGATPEQTASFLAPFGIRDKTASDAVYTYIAENPCNYPKYYLGYLEIEELKKNAKDTWKDQYSEKAFHTFFLQCGPSDFSSLKEHLPQNPPTVP